MSACSELSRIQFCLVFTMNMQLLYVCKQGPWVWGTCLLVKHICPPCVLLSRLTSTPPVFSRPNWPCRSSWPRAWQLASCPAPLPHQLCAQWQLTHWLCATQWAPPPSSRPHSWALHCFGLLRGRCGPHTHPSSSPPTRDLTYFPFELHSCPFIKPYVLHQCDPYDKGHTQTMQPVLLKKETVHKPWLSLGHEAWELFLS